MLQELEHLAKENQKIQRAISERKPFISAQALEHEYLENVSRIDRVATFRGPKRSSHLPTAVQDSLEVAKSMRETKWLPGTDGYQRDLAKSMGRSMRNRCAPVPLLAVKLGYISVDMVRVAKGTRVVLGACVCRSCPSRHTLSLPSRIRLHDDQGAAKVYAFHISAFHMSSMQTGIVPCATFRTVPFQ
jgi:hypothetical protein